MKSLSVVVAGWTQLCRSGIFGGKVANGKTFIHPFWIKPRSIHLFNERFSLMASWCFTTQHVNSWLWCNVENFQYQSKDELLSVISLMDSWNPRTARSNKIPSVNVHLDYVIKAIRNTLHHDLSIKLPSLPVKSSRQQRWWVYCFFLSRLLLRPRRSLVPTSLASIKSHTSIVITFYVNSIRNECRDSMNSKHQAMCQGWRGVCAQIAEVAERKAKNFVCFSSNSLAVFRFGRWLRTI